MKAKHILIPTDLSDLSLYPLEQAPELIENRVVTLLNVVLNAPMMSTTSPFGPAKDDLSLHDRLAESKASLETIAAAIPNAKEVRTESIAGTNMGKAVGKWASENDIDLIAISTHGRTGWRRVALGSVAELILRYATVPVLAFPAKMEADGEFD